MKIHPYLYGKPPITASMIRQMEFCPVIPWINTNLNYYEASTYSMSFGLDEVDAYYKENIARMLMLEKPWRFELYLIDKETGLSGVIDIVAGRKKLTIVEIKRFTRKKMNHYRNQLLAYAYLATKTLTRVERAVLVIDQKIALDIELTNEHLEHVEKEIKKLKNIIEKEQPPTPNKSINQCKVCQYRKLCPYTQIT